MTQAAISDIVFNYNNEAPFEERKEEIQHLLQALGFYLTIEQIEEEYQNRC